MKRILYIAVAAMLTTAFTANAVGTDAASTGATEKVVKRSTTKRSTTSRAKTTTTKNNKATQQQNTMSRQQEEPKLTGDVTVEVKTTMGDFTLRLYGETPKHRDNFVKNVKEGIYDGVLFHRVINEFMVQAGDPSSKNAAAGTMLGGGDLNYTVEGEFLAPKIFHKRGALAAARQGDQVNPERRSSASQFYVVTGRKFTDEQLDGMERQMQMQQMQEIFNRKAMAHMEQIRAMQQAADTTGLKELEQKLVAETEAEAAAAPARFSAEQREAYKTIGGTPHLDGGYTVFGEVLKGMDTIEKIEKVDTDQNDRPKEDVRIISMKIVDPAK